MTQTLQQSMTTSAQQVRLSFPDVGARVGNMGEGRPTEDFGKVLDRAKAESSRPADKPDRAEGGAVAHLHHNKKPVAKGAESPDAASRGERRGNAESRETHQGDQIRQDEGSEAQHDKERGEASPGVAEHDGPQPDGQAVSLAGASVQPTQDKMAMQSEAVGHESGTAESTDGTASAGNPVTSLATGQQVVAAPASKSQANLQAPTQGDGRAPVSPEQAAVAQPTKNNVEVVSSVTEAPPPVEDVSASVLSKVTDLLAQADRKLQELKNAIQSASGPGSQDAEYSLAEFRPETAQWTPGEGSTDETGRQFGMTSQPDHQKAAGPTGSASASPSSFSRSMMETGTSGSAISSSTGNGEVRGLSASQAPAAVRQPEDASPLPHTVKSVTVDLDPLDMGPLRVRVMMTDQTVHAHIRTEHGLLGQGLLQEGQQLESSLRTTGLEMGFLRVTVDQQQQGRHDGGASYQRPGQPVGRATDGSVAQVEAADGPPAPRQMSNGRVSYFA